MNDPSGPQIDILTYDMIYVDDLDTSSFENYKKLQYRVLWNAWRSCGKRCGGCT